MQNAVLQLKDLGATWEHPGYISCQGVAFGDANGEYGFNLEGSCEPLDLATCPSTMPEDSTSYHLSLWIRDIIGLMRTREDTKRLHFTTMEVADISTIHITPLDGKKILDGCSCRIAATYDGRGVYLWVVTNPNEEYPSEDQREQIERLEQEGFSQQFVEIFRQLQKQNIPYVRFDGDADEVEGLEKFDW